MASNFLLCLVQSATIVKALHATSQLYFLSHTNDYFIRALKPRLLPLHCKQINRVKNEVGGQPSNLLACMQVSDNKSITLMHFIFLELNTHHCHWDFKFLHESNKAIIQRHFISSYLRMSKRESVRCKVKKV